MATLLGLKTEREGNVDGMHNDWVRERERERERIPGMERISHLCSV